MDRVEVCALPLGLGDSVSNYRTRPSQSDPTVFDEV